MNDIISKLLVFLSVVCFGIAGYVVWITGDISTKLQTVQSQIRIYNMTEPDYSVFANNFDNKTKFGEFNTKMDSLLSKTYVNNVDFMEVGKRENIVYNKAVYDIEAEEGYLQFVKFVGYIHDSKIVHRINDLSIKAQGDGKLNVKVNFEVLGYVKEAN